MDLFLIGLLSAVQEAQEGRQVFERSPRGSEQPGLRGVRQRLAEGLEERAQRCQDPVPRLRQTVPLLAQGRHGQHRRQEELRQGYPDQRRPKTSL